MAKKQDESMSLYVRPSLRAQRLKSVRVAEFGRICRDVCELAAALFDMPLAFLKLADGEMLNTIAISGFTDIDVLDHIAFTERRLVAGEGLRIVDATRDARYFLESAVLRAPNIRFYIDMPLVHDGEILGVLALADTVVRDEMDEKLSVFGPFTDQVATLVSLAQQAEIRDDRLGELQAQQMRMDTAAEMTGLGYWKVDLATREVTWSKGLYALFGLDAQTVQPELSGHLDIYGPEERAAMIERFQKAVNSGEDFDFQLDIIRRNDKARRLIRTAGGVEYDADGAAVRLCAVVRDITADAKTPTADDFLSRVTDDLRAPLDAIVSYARRVEQQPVSGSEIGAYARDLLDSAEALQSAFEQRFSRETPVEDIEDGSDDEIVDVADVIRETVHAFAVNAQAAETRLSAHFVDFTRTQARLDVMRVQQVLQNLISNACKFTRGGVISVTASQVLAENPVTRMPETRLHVSVRDSGIGMSEAQARALFSGGKTGLGLSISKAIVEMLGGHIGAVSRPGEGANVWFELPVAWAETPAASQAAPVRDPRAVPVPRTLVRENLNAPPFDASLSRDPRPAYAPIRPRPDAEPPHQAVDEHRINREYLRALLQDMKLDI